MQDEAGRMPASFQRRGLKIAKLFYGNTLANRVRTQVGQFLGCAAAVGLAALLAGCAKAPLPARTAADLSYLPADVFFVAYADTMALKKSSLYRDWDSTLASEGDRFLEAKTFLRRLGIDPDKDLDGVMLAYRARRAAEGEWAALLRGRFDLEKMEKGLEDPSARMAAEPYREWTIYSLALVPEVGDISVALVDPATVALGRAESLRSILDTRERGADSLGSSVLMKQLIPALPREAQIWALLDGKALNRAGADRAGGLPMGDTTVRPRGLESVVSASFAATLADDLSLRLDIGSDSARRAQSLSDTLKGIVGFARMGSGSKNADLEKVIDALKVEGEGEQVRVRLRLPGDVVKRLGSELDQAGAAPGEEAR